MVDKHNQSFFGQSTGMFIQSSSKNEPFIFLQFIKKKETDTWEKLSLKEGKTIKCNLEEIVMMLRVLEGKAKSWSTVHVFKEEKTSISVSWEGEAKLWFNVGDYPKMLKFAQIEILRRLIDHILQEKIEFATVSSSKNSNHNIDTHSIDSANPLKPPHENNIVIAEEVDLGDKVEKIEGMIKGETDKALLINLENGVEKWFPKSIIKSTYTPENHIRQMFLVDSWFIEKNNIATT